MSVSVQTKAPNQLNVDVEQLQIALSQTQRLAGIGALTASVAHELTNPISLITTACNNLLSRVADDNLSTDELLHYLEMIDHSAWRCARLISALGSYSHIIDQEEARACDLNRVVEDALALVASQFSRQFNINIIAKPTPGLPAIHCDPNQITQVLINLLMNAKDSIRLNGVEAGIIEIKSWIDIDEPAVAFSVRDNGSGFRPGIEERIFTPFFTTKAVGEGTGLGLSIAKGIIEQHNGRITAQNHPDGGALFTILLPIS